MLNFNNDRPKVKIRLTLFDKILEAIVCGILVLMWILVIVSWVGLPDVIPVHYNEKGIADGFGDKMMIFLLPLVATVISVLLMVSCRFPHIFCYGRIKITPENARHEYFIAIRMMRILNLILVLLFGTLIVKTICI